MINDIFFALKILISIYIKRKKKIFLYLTIFISSYIIKFHNVNENKHKKKKKKKEYKDKKFFFKKKKKKKKKKD